MLYLLHHSAALDSDVDPQRPLSAPGRLHAERLAVEAASRGVRPVAIWHSGKLRARQTADLFRAACNPLAELSVIRGLRPTDPPEWIQDLVASESRDVMLVGHFPSLPRILHVLTADTDRGASADFPLHGLVALEEMQDGSWALRWELGRV